MSLLPGIDVSYYDGHGAPYIVTDWASYTWPFVFIKVSEGMFIDALFMRQWAAARGKVLRSAYHFFRPSVDPRLSAMKTVEYLRRENDLGELPLAFDLEDDDGMSNVLDRAKSWLSWYEAITGIRPIIYSSPGFLNKVKAASYPFLANYKLWLSSWPFDVMEPDAAREKRIADVISGAYVPSWPSAPAPFRRASFWQWTAQGKPEQVPGYYTGSRGKKEIDLNFYNGTLEELKAEFNVSTETPTDPPTGETPMLYGEVLVDLNIRKTADTTSAPIGLVKKGDRVEGHAEIRGWWSLVKITRAGQLIPLPAVPCYAYEGTTNGYIKVVESPIPSAEDKPRKVTIEMESGKVFVADQFTPQ